MTGNAVWRVEGDWPPTSCSLPPDEVRRVLDDAFDRYYPAAVASLAAVEVPAAEDPGGAR